MMPKYQELQFTKTPGNNTTDGARSSEVLKSCSSCLFRTVFFSTHASLCEHIPTSWVQGNSWAEDMTESVAADKLFAWLMRIVENLASSSESDLETAARRQKIQEAYDKVGSCFAHVSLWSTDCAARWIGC